MNARNAGREAAVGREEDGAELERARGKLERREGFHWVTPVVREKVERIDPLPAGGWQGNSVMKSRCHPAKPPDACQISLSNS